MIRANIFEELGNRNSLMVQDALSRACKICGANVGELCTALPINGMPLSGRLVHFFRTEVDG